MLMWLNIAARLKSIQHPVNRICQIFVKRGNEDIGKEVAALFNMITGYTRAPVMQHLMVAPFALRAGLLAKIAAEVKFAREEMDGLLGDGDQVTGIARCLEEALLDVAVGDDGRVGAGVVVTQTKWAITPYSTLFGTLKVADDVEVAIDPSLPAG